MTLIIILTGKIIKLQKMINQNNLSDWSVCVSFNESVFSVNACFIILINLIY